LWCHITQKELKEAPSAQEQPTPRDLNTLAAAHLQFTTQGKGDIKAAKKFYNVIASPFFPIPLAQVITTGCGNI
jgi:hypothetical protein